MWNDKIDLQIIIKKKFTELKVRKFFAALAKLMVFCFIFKIIAFYMIMQNNAHFK